MWTENVVCVAFRANGWRRYREHYALYLRWLAGEHLSPADKERAVCASYTHQRRLNDAIVEVTDGSPSDWVAWEGGYV